MSSGKFMYFAHPDIINYVGDDKIYEKHMTRLCENAKKYGVPLEINMLGLYDHRPYPSDRFFRIAAEVGNETVIGCDAHWPDAIAEERSLAAAMDLVERHGLVLKERVL
jgi:histidinol-phosphatase (PHP family)